MRMDAAGRESGIQGIELLMAGRRRGLSGQVTRLRTNSPISLSKTAASLMLTVNPRLNAVAAGRPAGAFLRQCGAAMRTRPSTATRITGARRAELALSGVPRASVANHLFELDQIQFGITVPEWQ